MYLLRVLEHQDQLLFDSPAYLARVKLGVLNLERGTLTLNTDTDTDAAVMRVLL